MSNARQGFFDVKLSEAGIRESGQENSGTLVVGSQS